MEQDLIVTVSGIANAEFAERLGKYVAQVVRLLADRFGLDLRRMHQVTVAGDYAAALADFNERHRGGGQVNHTSEEYATGVAQTNLYVEDDELRILLILSASLVAPLEAEDAPQDFKEQALHSLHHELCHVDDENKKIDGMAGIVLSERLQGKKAYTYSTAIASWSEYRACYLSASTIPDHGIKTYIDAAIAVQEQVKQARGAVNSYCQHGYINRVLNSVTNAGDLLARIYAYLFGTFDALSEDFESTATFEAVRGTEIEPDLFKLHKALQSMIQIYPDSWTSLAVYDELAEAMEDIYATLGIELRDQDDGGLWVEILH